MLLGKAPLTAVELVSTITESFPLHATAVDQTKFLRNALERLGISLGYTMASPQFGFRPNDSSFTLTWWQPGIGTVLAIACEWGNAGDVASAFTNLMTIKAPMKLVIFGSRDADVERPDILQRTDIDAVRKAVGAAIVDFSQHLEGELYVLLERVLQEGVFRAYDFVIPANGKLALQFEDAAHVFRAREAYIASMR